MADSLADSSLDKQNLTIYFKSCEEMNEVKDKSVDLFISGSLFLGKKWDSYDKLYRKIYLQECLRTLKDEGFLVIQQTDGYNDNEVFLKSSKLLELLSPHFRLIDVKIWKRCSVNFFQVPFSYFYILTKKDSKVGRTSLKSRGSYKQYLQGIWDYKQTSGSELNSWPDELCKLIIKTFTDEGDVILDPLAGTGRILSIGSYMKRICVGYEIDSKLKPVIEQVYAGVYAGGIT